uniref:Vacuolar protein-sorting-associated protein 36 n=1 Tax=Anthurium amnicola TaxID=1678845 RepID=A0A1D1YDF3_9ARAE
MNGEWLPQAHLTPSGRPVLQPGEVERYLLSAVDLETEENPSFAPLRSGLLTLTTHRLLWINESSNSGYLIPLASVIHAYPPKKSIRSMFHSPRIRLQVSASAEGRIGEKGSRSVMITIVLRGKNDPDAFFERLWDVLRSRAWEIEEKNREVSSIDGRESGPGHGDGPSRARIAMPVVGVSGILRKEQEIWESTDKSLQEAFQDLNALMVQRVLLS